jgi:hypothetical protein
MPLRPSTIVLAAVLQAACQARPHSPSTEGNARAEAPAPPELDPRTITVTLERTPCFGWCPVYAVALAPDGGVAFRATGAEGELVRRWKIQPESVVQLGRDFAQAGFFRTSDVVPPLPACGSAATDHPTIVLEVRDTSTTHRVHYYTGCLGADTFPPESMPARLHAPRGVLGDLTRLAARVDTLSGAVPLLDSLQAAEFFQRRRGA